MKKDINNSGQKVNVLDAHENSNSLRVLDLFCGAGGFSCGFEMAGHNVICGLELEKDRCKTYSRNFYHPVVMGDICDIKVQNELDNIVIAEGHGVDVIIGGPPCQGFSYAGRRNPNDERNKLVWEFINMVSKYRPKYFVIENVLGISTMLKGDVITQIRKAVRNLGYSVDFRLLNSADFGVAQARPRYIIIGNRVGVENIFPTPTHSKENWVSVDDVIGDIADMPDDKNWNHVRAVHGSRKIAEYATTLPGGRVYKYGSGCRRLIGNKPAWTAKSNNGDPYCHPHQNRTTTVREVARLQSFPDNFIFEGNKVEQYRQLGNAVPPLLAKALGESIKKMEEQRMLMQTVKV